MSRLAISGFTTITLSLVVGGISADSQAASPEAIARALRLSGVITGGTMPTRSPEFTAMADALEGAGNVAAAAKIAIDSKYGVGHLVRRIAFQMQNPTSDATAVIDNDATAYLIAHLSGADAVGAPSISKIWSNNVTCQVNVTRNGVVTLIRAADLRADERLTIDWKTALVCTPGQQARNATVAQNSPLMPIPPEHVGGYVTLSDRRNDGSLAEYGATAGTNLRYIYAIWNTATGMDLLALASATAPAQAVPRFVPANDPNFLVGQGQAACISCHGGGAVSVNAGYATVADVFNFGDNGFQYYPTQTTNTRKSLGSMGGDRERVRVCNMTTYTACNPDSSGVALDNSWDLGVSWGSRGLLAQMGWQGPTSGKGLNSLGAAIGKSTAVYTSLAKRVIEEICPLGAIKKEEVQALGKAAQGTDDFKQLVAKVASHPACL